MNLLDSVGSLKSLDSQESRQFFTLPLTLSNLNAQLNRQADVAKGLKNLNRKVFAFENFFESNNAWQAIRKIDERVKVGRKRF